MASSGTSSSATSYQLTSEEEDEEEEEEEEEKDDKEETDEVKVTSAQSGDRKFFQMSESDEDELRRYNTQEKASIGLQLNGNLPSLLRKPMDADILLQHNLNKLLHPQLYNAAQPAESLSDIETLRPMRRPRTQRRDTPASTAPKMVHDDRDDEQDSDDSSSPLNSYTNIEPRYVDLLAYVSQYQPRDIVLPARLYGPTVREIPTIIGKFDVGSLMIGRPDGKSVKLGVDVLDEPKLVQTDSEILGRKLQAIIRRSLPLRVKKLPHPRDKSLLNGWLTEMRTLQRAKPATCIVYKSRLPRVETLMQPWDPRVLRQIETNGGGLPLEAGMQCDLAGYVDIVCGLFDIPTGVDKTESLHLLFSLYLECRKEMMKVDCK